MTIGDIITKGLHWHIVAIEWFMPQMAKISPNYSTNFDHYNYCEYFPMIHNENFALTTIDVVEGMGFTK